MEIRSSERIRCRCHKRGDAGTAPGARHAHLPSPQPKKAIKVFRKAGIPISLRTLQNWEIGHRTPAPLAAQFEISSRARLRVRGPMSATASNATSIAAAMKTNTPATPEWPRMKAIMKPVNIAETRLQE